MRSSNDCPLVSVYVPTKDRPSLLKRAVESIAAQTYPSIEIIVIDDGSSEAVREDSFSCAVRILRNQRSLGACVSRNRAIEAASGEFITGLDDDDFFLPGRVSAFINKWLEIAPLNTNGSKRIAGLFDSVLVLPHRQEKGVEMMFSNATVSIKDMYRWNAVGMQVFAPKAHWLGMGGFDLQLPAWQDWDAWLRMAKLYGSFLSILQSSYVVDKSHDSPRISGSKGRIMRETQRYFERKHHYDSADMKLHLLRSRLSYPNPSLDVDDYMTLLRAKDFKTFLAVIKGGLRAIA
jgi:glycosyltransferase involved in cell wall biosynthesis